MLSEVFFADPLLLRHEYPDVYAQFAEFYRQDPAARAERLIRNVGKRLFGCVDAVAEGGADPSSSRARWPTRTCSPRRRIWAAIREPQRTSVRAGPQARPSSHNHRSEEAR